MLRLKSFSRSTRQRNSGTRKRPNKVNAMHDNTSAEAAQLLIKLVAQIEVQNAQFARLEAVKGDDMLLRMMERNPHVVAQAKAA